MNQLPPVAQLKSEATERGWLLLGALLRASRMLIQNPRRTKGRGRKTDFLGVRDLATRLDIAPATLSHLEMGKNPNPAAMLLKKIEAAGYVYDPQTQQLLNSSDFLAIACEEMVPTNPLTGQPFTDDDLVELKILEAGAKKTLMEPLNRALQLMPPQGKNKLSRKAEVFMFNTPPPLSEVIRAWLQNNPGRDWLEYVQERMRELQVPDQDVCLERMSAIAAGAQPQTTHELVFLWAILVQGDEPMFDLDEVRLALKLPDYDASQPGACYPPDWRHLVGNGNGY